MTTRDIIHPSPVWPTAPERPRHTETLADVLRRAQRSGLPIGAAQFEPAPEQDAEQKRLGNLLALGAAAALLNLASKSKTAA